MLLTLDLATNLGWTLGPETDPAFRHGSHRLPSTGEDIGAFATAYDLWLRERLFGGVDYVVFEAPVLPRETSLATVRKLSGLAWHTEFRCTMMNIRCEEASNTSVKKFVAGHGFAKKNDMLAAIRARGYEVADHDEADAIAVRLYTIHQRFPKAAACLNLDMGALGVAAAAQNHG